MWKRLVLLCMWIAFACVIGAIQLSRGETCVANVKVYDTFETLNKYTQLDDSYKMTVTKWQSQNDSHKSPQDPRVSMYWISTTPGASLWKF